MEKHAKGDGPLASQLKIPPANLTLLAMNHGGKYPSDYVSEIILTGPRDAKSHGSQRHARLGFGVQIAWR